MTGDWSKTIEDTPQGFLAGAYENTNMHLLGIEQKQASRRKAEGESKFFPESSFGQGCPAIARIVGYKSAKVTR